MFILGKYKPLDNAEFTSSFFIYTIMTSSSAKAKLLAKNDNDVVIVAAVRSALTKVCHHP